MGKIILQNFLAQKMKTTFLCLWPLTSLSRWLWQNSLPPHQDQWALLLPLITVTHQQHTSSAESQGWAGKPGLMCRHRFIQAGMKYCSCWPFSNMCSENLNQRIQERPLKWITSQLRCNHFAVKKNTYILLFNPYNDTIMDHYYSNSLNKWRNWGLENLNELSKNTEQSRCRATTWNNCYTVSGLPRAWDLC